MRETLRECREHARRLAVALHDKHYPEVTQWRPLDDLLGIIDQIDNMTTGLTRHPAPLSEEMVERVARAIIVHNRQMVGDDADYAYADAILASDDAGDAGEAFAARELARVALETLAQPAPQSPPQGGSN